MNERFSRLYVLPGAQYVNGAPVIISAGALLKDNATGKVLVQLKLTNLYESILTACKVTVFALDPGGAELSGVDNFVYLDITVSRGEDFGTKTPIELPDISTRKFSVSVIEAVYENGQIWRLKPCDGTLIPEQALTKTYFSDVELRKQYSLEIGGDCEYVPTIRDGLFLCTCGQINLSSDVLCSGCGRNPKRIMEAFDLEYLEKKKTDRLEQEKEQFEKQRVKALDTKKKAVKYCSIVAVIAIITVVCVTIAKEVIIPQRQYNKALELLDAKDYDGAEKVFTELGDYRDSVEQIEDIPYKQAEDLLNDGDYEEAAKAFRKLGDYADSESRVTEIYQLLYDQAVALLDAGDYEEAISILEHLSDYENVEDDLEKARYLYAIELEDAGQYAEAFNIVSKISDNYLDAAKLKKYIEANKDYENGDYENAASLYLECGSYEEASAKYTEIVCKLAGDLISESNDFISSKDYDSAIESLLNAENYCENANQIDEITQLNEDIIDCLDMCYLKMGDEAYNNGMYNTAENYYMKLSDTSTVSTKINNCSTFISKINSICGFYEVVSWTFNGKKYTSFTTDSSGYVYTAADGGSSSSLSNIEIIYDSSTDRIKICRSPGTSTPIGSFIYSEDGKYGSNLVLSGNTLTWYWNDKYDDYVDCTVLRKK